MIDKKAIEEHIRGILVALGDDPNREGLIDTPKRVAQMYEEVFEGMNYTNEEIAHMFDKTFSEDYRSSSSDVVLMYDMKVSVAYIPKGKVIGLSKIARIADMAAKRLQLQERLGNDIAEIMAIVTGSEDVAVMIEGCHSCMTARGIKNISSKTYTTTLRGKFETDTALQMRIRG